MMTTGNNASIGDGTGLDYPLAPDVIQEDGNNDGWAICDDPIIISKGAMPRGLGNR